MTKNQFLVRFTHPQVKLNLNYIDIYLPILQSVTAAVTRTKLIQFGLVLTSIFKIHLIVF